MTATFINISNTKFSLNGLEYHKVFIPVKVSDTHLKIVNVYDTKFVLLQATRFDDITVDGAGFASLTDALNSLVNLVFSKVAVGGEVDLQTILDTLGYTPANDSEVVKSVDPNYFTGTDAEKIQGALDFAVANNRKLIINPNSLGVWLLDEAILVPSNAEIIINSKIKLSDNCRDNFFRSANVGIGITDPFSNVLENISITGTVNALLEGADNPRATGDSNKTLTNVYSEIFSRSYGSDAGTAEKQTGDWRNIGILLACCKNIKLENLRFKNAHSYSISLERCESYIIRGMSFDCPEKRNIGGAEVITRNMDGVDIRLGSEKGFIENITGMTGDDSLALITIDPGNLAAGTLDDMSITGNVIQPIGDINNITIKDVNSISGANNLRLLCNGGAKIKNININNINDASTDLAILSTGGAVVTIGSISPLYAGPPIGDLSNISITDVRCNNMTHAVEIEGSLSESVLDNIIKLPNNGFPAIYVNPDSTGVRNVICTNIIEP